MPCSRKWIQTFCFYFPSNCRHFSFLLCGWHLDTFTYILVYNLSLFFQVFSMGVYSCYANAWSLKTKIFLAWFLVLNFTKVSKTTFLPSEDKFEITMGCTNRNFQMAVVYTILSFNYFHVIDLSRQLNPVIQWNGWVLIGIEL